MSRSIFLLISVISSEGGRHYNTGTIDAVEQESILSTKFFTQTLFLSKRRYSAVFHDNF